MSDTVEKIYCDHGGSNDALYALLANQNKASDPATMAALMNNQNQWGNNPFAYLIWLVFAMRMWGNNGEGNGINSQMIEMQNQLAAMRTQIQDNQNSNLIMDAVRGNQGAIAQLASNLNCNFNTLNTAVCDVRGGIDKVAGQIGFSAERVINAVQLGQSAIIQQLQTCCCDNKELVQRMGYENQLALANQNSAIQAGFTSVNNTLTQGFAQSNFAAQQRFCDLEKAGLANTQRIVDTLTQHWTAEQALKVQDLKFENSQLRQNQYLKDLISGTTTTTTTV